MPVIITDVATCSAAAGRGIARKVRERAAAALRRRFMAAVADRGNAGSPGAGGEMEAVGGEMEAVGGGGVKGFVHFVPCHLVFCTMIRFGLDRGNKKVCGIKAFVAI